MSMSKKQLREWPWNNRPSKRHVWTTRGNNDHCVRCGSTYVRAGGGTAAVYCYATPQWLKEHPEDDGAQG